MARPKVALQTVFMTERESNDFITVAREAVKDVKGDPALVKLDDTQRVRLTIIRPPSASNPPDGDALNGFTRPSYPEGCVIRFRPVGEVRVQRLTKGCRLMCDPVKQRDLRAMLRIKNRGVSSKPEHRIPKPLKCPSQDKYGEYVPVTIPRQSKYLEEVADAVGGFNDDNEGSLAPYLLESIYPIAAAVSIQATWRSRYCRKTMQPPLLTRVLERRASVTIQRWWRAYLFHMRTRMLSRLRELLDDVDNVRELCITKGSYAHLSNHHNRPPPRIYAENRLPYSFDPYATSFIITPVNADGPPLRTGIPAWLDLDMPVVTEKELGQMLYGMTESVLGFDDVLPLIHKGVETAEAVNLSSALFGKESTVRVTEDMKFHKIYRFASCEEARRRVALLFLLTWDNKVAKGVELVVDHSSAGTVSKDQNIAELLAAEHSYEDRELCISPYLLRRIPPKSRIHKYGHAARRRIDETPLIGTVEWQTGVKYDREDPDFLRRNPPADVYRPFSSPELSAGELPEPELDLDDAAAVGPAPAARERMPSLEAMQRQAQYAKEELAFGLDKRARDEYIELLRYRQQREADALAPIVIRSTNTSSLPASASMDTTPRREMNAIVQKMKSEHKSQKEAVARQQREAMKAQLEAAKKDMQSARMRNLERHQEEHGRNVSRMELNTKIENEICRRKVACRKWQRARQLAMKAEHNFVRLFECQHNALSKQMLGAEVRHLQGMDWQYTRREVDGRRQQTQQRRQEVGLELEIHQATLREGAMDASAKIAMLKEKQMQAAEQEREFVRQRVQAEKNRHFEHAPKLGPLEITNGKERTQLKMVQIVSAT